MCLLSALLLLPRWECCDPRLSSSRRQSPWLRLAQERRWSNMRSAELVGVAQTIACCGEVSRVSGRGQVAQRGVRPGLIIRNHPPCDGGAGVIEIIEQGLVE